MPCKNARIFYIKITVFRNELEMNSEGELVGRIRSSFFHEKWFKREDISKVFPGYPEYEPTAIASFFENKTNSEITIGHLVKDYKGDESAYITFMYPEAKAYFIGSYMKIAVEEENWIGFRLTLCNWLGGEHDDISGVKKEREHFLSLISLEQLEVIEEVIEYIWLNYAEDELLEETCEKALEEISEWKKKSESRGQTR